MKYINFYKTFALLLTTTLLFVGSAAAMNNYPQAICEAYLDCCKSEQKLANTASEKAFEEYYIKLINFFQLLFRAIVAQDIKKGLPYTKAHGLTLAPNGELIMRLNQFTKTQVLAQNTLRSLLMLDVVNPKIIIDLLKKLHAEAENKTKNADAFFPEIVLIANDSKELPISAYAGYTPESNTLLIRKKHFSIFNCEDVLHEFVHKRQYPTGTMAMGGTQFHLVDPNSPYKSYPIAVAIELEAEYRGIIEHPFPKDLLHKLLQQLTSTYTKPEITGKKATNEFSKYAVVRAAFKNRSRGVIATNPLKETLIEDACFNFPYFRPIRKYHVLRTNFNIADEAPYWNKIANKVETEVSATQPMIITACAVYNNDARSKYLECLKIMLLEGYRTKIYEADINQMFREALFKKVSLTKEQKEMINNAKIARNGSTEFFELKKKLGLIPK